MVALESDDVPRESSSQPATEHDDERRPSAAAHRAPYSDEYESYDEVVDMTTSA